MKWYKSEEERIAAFWRRIDKSGDCWLWMGARDNLGYGRAVTKGRQKRLAHRLSWELTNGPIPDGMCVLHRCDNPPCVNPAHLWLGTRLDNNRDMFAKGRGNSTTLPAFQRSKTHCRQGHEYTDENTYRDPDGYRECRTCIRIARSESARISREERHRRRPELVAMNRGGGATYHKNRRQLKSYDRRQAARIQEAAAAMEDGK